MPSKTRILLSLIPSVMLVLGVAMYSYIHPFYAGLLEYDYDPAYAYLMNGAGILHGFSPNHVDHPGTPMQLFCAGVTSLLWLVTQFPNLNTASLDLFVLSNPELALSCISFILLVLNVGATYYLGVVVYRITRSLRTAAVMQLSTLFLNGVYFRIMYVNGEALSIFAGLLLLALIVRETFDPGEYNGDRSDSWTPFVCGCLTAIAITSKITFAPYVLMIFLMRNPRRIRNALLSFIISTLIILIPIRLKIADFVRWIYSITTHSGIYGGGANDYVDTSEIPHHFAQFFESYPISIAAIGLAGAAFLYTFHPSPLCIQNIKYKSHRRVIIFLVAASVLSVIMTLKHYKEHYAIPMVLLTGIILMYTSLLFTELFPTLRTKSIARLILVFIFISLGAKYTSLFLSLYKSNQVRTTELYAIDNAIAGFEHPIIIGAYRVPNQQFAMQFGLSFVADSAARQFTGGAEDQVSYDSWQRKLRLAGGGLKGSEFLRDLARNGRPILLLLPEGVTVSDVSSRLLLKTVSGLQLFQVVS